MPAIIDITDEDIEYSENILLNEGHFDEERRAFIKNIDTLDLQAVPGSGKTTVLLAKLLIIERYLPLEKNRGILVLSHTNVAIDEIIERIGRYCPKLFSYPNFVGTIQSFVDQFLAIPYYNTIAKRKPYRIDNEIYDEQIEKYSLPYGANLWVNQKHDPIKFLKSLRLDENYLLTSGVNKNAKDFELKNPNTNTYKALVRMKKRILTNGYLHFDDAYLLAVKALNDYSKLKLILQERFKYVFVDEMQDMDNHQYELLERVFFDDGNSKSIYQRIGDKNQAIFNGEVSLEDIWEDRAVVLKLKGSHRLTSINAELVNCLILQRDQNYEVIGLNSGIIKPHILVYTDNSIKNIIPTYSRIIQEFIDSNTIENNNNNSYNVIGWIKEHLEDNKISIKDYCDEFEAERSVKRIDYQNLDTYLKLCDKSKETLEPYRKNILNALVRILRYEEVINLTNGRPFTKKNLMNYLKKDFFNEYELLKLHLYNWSIKLVKGNFDNVYQELKDYIPNFLNIFEKTINNSSDFINNPSDTTPIVLDGTNQSKNIVNHHGFDISVGTIHSAKGQTHTCTLYLETFHKNGGGGNYEWQRLSNQLKYTPYVNSTTKIVKQTLKMAYVGLSRPTDLLCIAIHQDRFNVNLSDIDTDKWEVLNVNLSSAT